MSAPRVSVPVIHSHRIGLRRLALTLERRKGRPQMQVRDGMSEITLTVGPTHTLREAAAKMVEKGTGAALVIDGEMPTPSVVTERDLLISVAGGHDPDRERVCDHMSEGVLTAAPD